MYSPRRQLPPPTEYHLHNHRRPIRLLQSALQVTAAIGRNVVGTRTLDYTRAMPSSDSRRGLDSGQLGQAADAR